MIDTSTDLKKFNMFNGKCPGEYTKTIIIGWGNSGSGKSSLCDELTNEKVDYINLDECLTHTDHGIESLKTFVETCDGNRKRPILRVVEISQFISDNCCDEFTEFMFNKYIVGNACKTILLDQYSFKHKNLYERFIHKCRIFNYRVWEINRTL